MVAGIAAIIGGLSAACILEKGNPFIIYQIYGVCGLFVSVAALFIPKRLEEDQETIEGQLGVTVRSLSDEMKHNFDIIYNCLKIKEMNHSLSFFTLIGFTVPRFDDFLYYYKTGPAGFS